MKESFLEIKLLSDRIYFKNRWKKAHYNRPDISFIKNINSVTAEASNSEDTILFNGNLSKKKRYHWIDYLHAFSIRNVRFTFPTNKNVDYELKWTFQIVKHSFSEFWGIIFSFSQG